MYFMIFASFIKYVEQLLQRGKELATVSASQSQHCSLKYH